MISAPNDVLLICYGNPGRLDDGLGVAFAEHIQFVELPGVTLEVDYQLNVELAADMARHRYAIFVDATLRGSAPFTFRPVLPGPRTTFSTHSLEPDGLLALARGCFGAVVEAYALAIRGYEFDDFGEQLSPRARDNLTAALQFMLPVLERRCFAQAAAGLHAVASHGEKECKTEST